MTSAPVLLDCAALSDMALEEERGPSSVTRAMLRMAWEQGREVFVPAVVCAEVCRGQSRTRAVESLLARHDSKREQKSPIRVVDTTFSLARLVGAVLYAGSAGSRDLVDAHLVAICIEKGGGIVLTSDPGDIERLSAPFLGVRIVVRKI